MFIICATGYRRGLEPLVGHLDVLDERGVPLDDGARLADRGLWFLGFQSRPGLIGSVAKRSVASRRPSARRSPLAAEKFRFQDQVGYERLVLGVRPVSRVRHCTPSLRRM